ncbi:DUF21 domain-containing protein [Candidatus Saccharibacteria bacterium]|nr:DUF21 domain-containing protein [Candidatus Saccharibacteria bacterium]
MSIGLYVLEIFFLIGLAGICSGLNVALLSLDFADLKRKVKLGNHRAKLVLPLRKKTHLALASILLTGVAVVSTTSLLLEHALNGLLAGIITTLLVVVFGEIVPQAYFARYALTFTALFAPLLRLMIIVTYPVSKPLQLLLDKMLGDEKTSLASRQELGIIIAEHSGHKSSELDEDEIEIMQGAIGLSEKRVRDVMMPIGQVYWLTPYTMIDADKIDEIKSIGHSRIPIFDKKLTECYGILLQKDLVDIDFDERAYRVDELPIRPVKIVGSMTALDTAFRKFINSHSHLTPVERDDKIVGIITIEDILEEIIGQEIEDEKDLPRSKRLKNKFLK